MTVIVVFHVAVVQVLGTNSCEQVKTLKYLGSLLTNKISIYKELKCKGSRSRWSRGNVLASRSKVRGFKPG